MQHPKPNPAPLHPALRVTGFVQDQAQVRTDAAGQPCACFTVLVEGPACPQVHVRQPYPNRADADAAARRLKKSSYVCFDINPFGLSLHVHGVGNLQRLPDPVSTTQAQADQAEPELFP